MDTKPFVNLFNTNGAFFIYDVNKNSILKTDEKVWKRLKNYNFEADVQGEENSREDQVIRRLKESGFLSSNKVKQIIHPTDEIIDDYLSNRVEMITLQVTQQCNFRCEYCPYSGGYENRSHANKRMSLEMAKKGVDFLISHSSEINKIFVGFYGGEPLLEFDLIENIVEYVKENSIGKEVHFSITTNGTLLNKKILDFFVENDVSLVISLDGPKEIHDNSRKFAFNNCGTFDTVMEKIENIKHDYPEYMKKVVFNAVLDPQNDISCVNNFFKDYEVIKEAIVTFNEKTDYYAKTDATIHDTYSQIIEYEYFKLLLSKLKKLNFNQTSKIASRMFTDLENTYKYLKVTDKLPEKTHHAGPCIPGAQRLFLNANGDFFPCERVSETSLVTNIGNIEHGLDVNKIRKILNVGSISEQSCKNCWAIRFCNLCVAAADDGNDLSQVVKSKRCSGARISFENKLKDICTLKAFGYNFAVPRYKL